MGFVVFMDEISDMHNSSTDISDYILELDKIG